MNAEIKRMLDRPGKYAVTTSKLGPGVPYCMVEVLGDGTCYQLDSQGRRGKTLHPDGWNPLTRVYRPTDDDTFVRLGAGGGPAR